MPYKHASVLAAALAGSLALAPGLASAQATGSDIFHSGPLDLVIDESSSGIRFNWETGEVCRLIDTCDDWLYTVAFDMWWHWNGKEFVTEPGIYVKHPDLGLVYSADQIGVLRPGDTVHSGLQWGIGLNDWGGSTDYSPSAPWHQMQDAYLGFRFRNRRTHELNYGYAHLRTNGAHGLPATLVDYAYDTTGQGITIPGPDVPSTPDVRSGFQPDVVRVGWPSTLTLELRNPNPIAATLTSDFTFALPNGLVAASATTTCPGGNASNPSPGSVRLATGAQIPAQGSCTMTATVQSSLSGTYSSTATALSLRTDQGDYPADTSATLRVFDSGGPFPPDEDFDSAAAPALPSTGWFSIYWLGNSLGLPSLPASAWTTTTSKSDSGTASAYVTDATVLGGGGYATDISLLSPVFSVGRGGTVRFRQSHDFFETDRRWFDDGGVLEISIDGGPFEDILESGGRLEDGIYMQRVTEIYGNVLGGRLAWGGDTGDAWYTVTAGFPPQAEGRAVQLRWRFGTDSTNNSHWWIDSVHTDVGTMPNTYPPRVEAAFAPRVLVAGGSSRLTLTLFNDQPFPLPLTQDFVDPLPPGLVASNPSTTCLCSSATCPLSVGSGSELRLPTHVDVGGWTYTVPPNGSCVVEADVRAATPGSYLNAIAPASLQLNWEFSNRTPASARLIATAATDCLFGDGFDGTSACAGAAGAAGVYTDAASFAANIAPDYREDFFDTIPSGQRLAWSSGGDGPYGFSLEAYGLREIGLYAKPNGVSTSLSTSAVMIRFAHPVTAVGGNFWVSGPDNKPAAAAVVIQLSDGTSYPYTSAGPDDFIGIVTDTPISAITIDAPGDESEDLLFTQVSNLIVGSRR